MKRKRGRGRRREIRVEDVSHLPGVDLGLNLLLIPQQLPNLELQVGNDLPLRLEVGLHGAELTHEGILLSDLTSQRLLLYLEISERILKEREER